MNKEKREYPRKEVIYTALFCFEEGAFSVKIKDLSRSGAAVIFKRNTIPVKGKKAELFFYAADAQKLISKLPCKIVRTFTIDNHPGAGLQFDTLDDSIGEIIEYLESISQSETLDDIEKSLSILNELNL